MYVPSRRPQPHGAAADTSRPRRVFGAGIVVGILASIGAIQVPAIVAGAVVAPAPARPTSSSSTAEYHLEHVQTPSDATETFVPESATDEYRRMYGRGAGLDGSLSMTSTDEYRQMYEHR